jgi:hypothetical protein
MAPRFNPPFFGQKSDLQAVLWIHDILARIRIWIHGSIPLTYGIGFEIQIRILLFSSVADKMPTKNKFCFQSFLLLTFNIEKSQKE